MGGPSLQDGEHVNEWMHGGFAPILRVDVDVAECIAEHIAPHRT